MPLFKDRTISRDVLKSLAPTICLLICGLASAAFAEEKEGPVDFFAEAAAIDEFCDRYEIDMDAVGQLLATNGIVDITTDQDAKARFEARYESAMWATKSMGDKSCISGDVFYGPEGSKVRGLLKPL